MLNIEEFSNKENEVDPKILEVKISLSEKDATDIHPHNDDIMVITWMGNQESSRRLRKLCKYSVFECVRETPPQPK